MANIASVEKRARQSLKRRARNQSVRSGVKTAAKKARTVAAGGDSAEARAEVGTFASKLDKAAKRGVIHRNAANRGKSRLRKALAKKATAA